MVLHLLCFIIDTLRVYAQPPLSLPSSVLSDIEGRVEDTISSGKHISRSCEQLQRWAVEHRMGS